MSAIVVLDENRDPNNINGFLKTSIENVLAETNQHSNDCLWRSSSKVYTYSQNCCYKFLTLIFGLPMALVWGCLFAVTSFEIVWLVSPSLKLLEIRLESFRRFLKLILQTCFHPIFEMLAVVYSRISITLTRQDIGQNYKYMNSTNAYSSVKEI